MLPPEDVEGIIINKSAPNILFLKFFPLQNKMFYNFSEKKSLWIKLKEMIHKKYISDLQGDDPQQDVRTDNITQQMNRFITIQIHYL